MRLYRITFACLLAASSVYCRAADESILDLVYVHGVQADKRSSGAAPIQMQAPPPARSCAVLVKPPNDVRRNKDTLGTTFRDNPILSNQSPTLWLEAALLDLKRQGFATASGQMQGSPAASRVATLSTDLDKLYIWNHSLNLHATLVVKVKMLSSSGDTLEKKYRVNSTKLNWWNADGEFVDTINLAAGRLLERLAADIDSFCRSTGGT